MCVAIYAIIFFGSSMYASLQELKKNEKVQRALLYMQHKEQNDQQETSPDSIRQSLKQLSDQDQIKDFFPCFQPIVIKNSPKRERKKLERQSVHIYKKKTLSYSYLDETFPKDFVSEEPFFSFFE